MRFVWTFDDSRRWHSTAFPHLVEAMPIIALALTTAVQPFEHDLLAVVMILTYTLPIANNTVIVVVPMQLSLQAFA